MYRQFALSALAAVVTASHATVEECNEVCEFIECRYDSQLTMFLGEACVRRECSNKCTGNKCRYQWYSKNDSGNFDWNDESCSKITGCPDFCDTEIDCSEFDISK